jgi:hypothetical protein
VDRQGQLFKGRNGAKTMAMACRYLEGTLDNAQPAIGEINDLRLHYSMTRIEEEARQCGACAVETAAHKIASRPALRYPIQPLCPSGLVIVGALGPLPRRRAPRPPHGCGRFL